MSEATYESCRLAAIVADTYKKEREDRQGFVFEVFSKLRNRSANFICMKGETPDYYAGMLRIIAGQTGDEDDLSAE